MTDQIDLATGDLELIDNLYGASSGVIITCPERSGSCVYQHGPDRPDDYELVFLLDHPYCETCGCSLVVMSSADYDGPEDDFHDLTTKGSPVV